MTTNPAWIPTFFYLDRHHGYQGGITVYPFRLSVVPSASNNTEADNTAQTAVIYNLFRYEEIIKSRVNYIKAYNLGCNPEKWNYRIPFPFHICFLHGSHDFEPIRGPMLDST